MHRSLRMSGRRTTKAVLHTWPRPGEWRGQTHRNCFRQATLVLLLAFLQPHAARAQTTITITNWNDLVTNWVQTSAPLGQQYEGLALSPDGSKQAATFVYWTAASIAGGILTSTNSGQDWTPSGAPDEAWTGIASSADGSTLFAVWGLLSDWARSSAPRWISRSTDSGLTWTQTSAPTQQWHSIACSADGTKVVAAGYPGQIFTSADSGNSWVQTSARNDWWLSAISSPDGTWLAAVIQGGGIYISTNSGATWAQTGAPSAFWDSLAASVDGTRLIAANDSVALSTNGGGLWTPANLSGEVFDSVACSSNGTVLAAGGWTDAGSGGLLYVSTDSGATWQQASLPSSNWGVHASADGTRLVAYSEALDGIWTAQATIQTIVVPTLSISQSANTVTVSWQALSGWTLQHKSSLTSPGGWSPSAGVSTSNGTNSLNLTSPVGQMFFRLTYQ